MSLPLANLFSFFWPKFLEVHYHFFYKVVKDFLFNFSKLLKYIFFLFFSKFVRGLFYFFFKLVQEYFF